MILMKYKGKSPARILGVGEFAPGGEYPLPDVVAQGLIATKDRDWEQVKKHRDPGEGESGSIANRGRK